MTLLLREIENVAVIKSNSFGVYNMVKNCRFLNAESFCFVSLTFCIGVALTNQGCHIFSTKSRLKHVKSSQNLHYLVLHKAASVHSRIIRKRSSLPEPDVFPRVASKVILPSMATLLLTLLITLRLLVRSFSCLYLHLHIVRLCLTSYMPVGDDNVENLTW